MAPALSRPPMQIEHSEFQDQLVRGLAHRMNNILTLFNGYVGLMLENKKLDPRTLENLTRIKDGAKAATELMDRTHSLVRPSTVVWREVDVPELIRLLRPRLEAFRSSNTEFQIEAPDEVPRVYADLNRLKTALVELVRNACEAIPEGGTVEIRVNAAETVAGCAAQALQWVSVDVTDSGPGISEEMQERIFAPFFTTKKKRNAAGLGLTVALGAAQQLGGSLRLASEPGRTTFSMILPSRNERQ